MAGILSLFGRRYDEPMPRIWHTSCQTGSKALVHGGRTKDYSENTKQRLSSVVESLDAYTEQWKQKEVTGEAPAPGVHAAASASIDDDLFTFGGTDGSRWYNTLHRLKGTSQWIKLCPQKKSPESPMIKSAAGMVAFSDNLAVVGGYGIPHGPTQPGSSFIKDTRFTDGRGWTNEFHIYNLKDDVWIFPDIAGERPPPCAAFTFTSIDNRRAVLFGGERMTNDVYIIDLLTRHWTKLKKSGDGPWPEERIWHAACCLNYGQQHPPLLVTGGVNRKGKPLGDAWVLKVDSGRWRKVSGTLQPRWSHSTTAFCLVDGVTEVTMFGGSADPRGGSPEELSKLADTILLQFCCSGQSEWKLVSVTPFSKFGSEERVSVKKIQREERERQMEKRLRRAEERVQQAEQQVRGMGGRVRQAQALADDLQRKLDEVEGREQERLAVQQQAIAAEQRGPSWEVGENDLQLTGEVIGIGGWAEVRVAHLKVAAKKLHSQLVYDYHRRLFQREMAVAARVSHPNLLRFHGAKLEGGMTILTELMPTSLRAEVERGHRYPEHRLSREHILSIAMDVACALNYLHHLIPDPIIHRDLSSANVLLKPTPNGGWLAKVSDYGSANFQQQLQTQNPGSPVYAAPESINPALQSPKMDIFSFGVLLIEMCTCHFPEPERRPGLIESIQYPRLVALIRQCLNEDQNQRPTAAQVIEYLQTLQ